MIEFDEDGKLIIPEVPVIETPTDLDAVTGELARWESLRREYDEIVAQIKAIQAPYRQRVLDYMNQTGGKHMQQHGFSFIRVETKKVTTGDARLLMETLEEQELLGRYMIVDVNKVADELGDDFPGLRIIPGEYIQLKVPRT